MKYFLISLLLLTSCFTSQLQAHRLFTKPTEFLVDGHKAFVLKADKPAEGSPWVWYAPTLSRHPDSSHTWYIKQLLAKGISIAGCDLGEVRGSARSVAEFTKFYEQMIKRGFSKKPMLLGQSRGGLMMLSWAIRNPDKVKGFAGIYPVCNIESWPMVSNLPTTLKDFDMNLETLKSNLKKVNPIHHLAGLAKHSVPMFIVHGDSDRVVPLKDNSAIIEKNYLKLGGKIKIKTIPGKGHAAVDEFFKCEEMIQFLTAPK
jgi:pimeloyl-ACP methyl ester carboxylesterase